MHWRIIVRVYANLEGLSKKYTYIDFIEEKKVLRHFVAGFTQSQPLFDFIDAGQGKERADHKIKGLCTHLSKFRRWCDIQLIHHARATKSIR